MTTTATHTEPTTTGEDIDAAIMAACGRAWAAGRHTVAWTIASRVPGGFWQLAECLLALHYSGRFSS